MTYLYTFSLLGELILVPGVAFIAVLHAYSTSDKDYAIVTNFLNGIIGLLGIGIIIYSGYQIKVHFEEVAQVRTALNYLLPVLLTSMFIPLVYLNTTRKDSCGSGGLFMGSNG